MKKAFKLKLFVVTTITFLFLFSSYMYAQHVDNSATVANISDQLNKTEVIKPQNSSSNQSRSVKKLYLKAIIEGFYNYSTNTMNKTHDVSLPSYNIVPVFPGAIVDTLSVIINYVDTINGVAICYSNIYPNVTFDTNGVIAPITVLNTDTAKFYIMISHRSSIDTWSAVRFKLYGNDSISYDFTNSVTKAFGNNQKLITPNKAAIFSGEVGDLYSPYNDGVINIYDLSAVYDAINDNSGMMNIGYSMQDLNGDGVVNMLDMVIVFDNLNLGVASVFPPGLCN